MLKKVLNKGGKIGKTLNMSSGDAVSVHSLVSGSSRIQVEKKEEPNIDIQNENLLVRTSIESVPQVPKPKIEIKTEETLIQTE